MTCDCSAKCGGGMHSSWCPTMTADPEGRRKAKATIADYNDLAKKAFRDLRPAGWEMPLTMAQKSEFTYIDCQLPEVMPLKTFDMAQPHRTTIMSYDVYQRDYGMRSDVLRADVPGFNAVAVIENI